MLMVQFELSPLLLRQTWMGVLFRREMVCFGV